MITRTTVAAAALSVMAGVASAQLGAQAARPAQTTTASPSAPTFSKDVAPIFFKNCTNCHRPGEIAPMSLLTFKDARPWAKSIATQVSKGTMPPWHADPSHGAFLNDRRLTEAEKDTIVKWANAGAPEGNAADMPAAPTYATEWLIGKPDAVFSMQEDYPIPAEGDDHLPVFRGADQVHRGQVDSGDGSACRQSGCAAPRDRLCARAATGGAARSSSCRTGSRGRRRVRSPVFIFDRATSAIPAGAVRRAGCPRSRSRSDPNDRPAPRRMGPSIGGFAPGQFDARLPGRARR